MSRRLVLYPLLLLFTLAGAFIFVVTSGEGSTTASGRVGGDYPAFYAAGTLVNDGRIDELYDPRAQAEVQDTLLGSDDGYLSFAYAPHVAAAYAPLAKLPYRASYVVHTLLMAAALGLALHLIRPLVSIVDRWFTLVLAAIITSYPMFMAIGGGQNTALTFLLLAVVWRALADDRETLAGVAAAVLLFRPQYAIPVIGLLLLGRHHRAVAAALAGSVLIFLTNAAILGWSWVSEWTDSVGQFLETNAAANAANSVSTVGFLRALLGTDSPVALGVGLAFTLAVIGVLAWLWWDRSADLALCMAATATGVVLLSPQALFYDAGLIALTLLVLVDRDVVGWRTAALVWALGFLHFTRGVLGADPFALVVIGLFVIVANHGLVRPSGVSGAVTLAPAAGRSPAPRVADPRLV
jgi:glycosyl transferase family 87